MTSARESFDSEKERYKIFQPRNTNNRMIIEFVAVTARILREQGRLRDFVFIADRSLELLQDNLVLKKLMLFLIFDGEYFGKERFQCTEMLKYYLEVEKLFDYSTHEKNLRMNIFYKIGEAYLLTSHYSKTLKYTRKSEEIAFELGDKPMVASCCAIFGNACHNLGEYIKAIDYFHKGLEINTAIGDCSGTLSNLGNLGNVYLSLGEYEKAIDYYQRSLEISIEIGDQSGIARNNGNLGSTCNNLGEYGKAICYYAKGLEISSAIGDLEGIARNSGNLGNAYLSLGEYEKAICYFEEGLEISSAIEDLPGIASNNGNLGSVCLNLGEYDKAIRYYVKGLEISSKIGDQSGIAINNENLGNAYFSLGEYKKAIDYYKKGLEINSAIGNLSGIASNNGNLGNTSLNLGEYNKAIDYYWKSLELSTAIGDRSGIASNNANLGNAYLGLEEHEKAIAYFQKGLEITTAIGDRSGISSNNGNLGNAYLCLSEYEKAIDYYQKGVEISSAIGDRAGVANNNGNLGNAYFSQGLSQSDNKEASSMFQQAVVYLKKSVHGIDEIFSDLDVDENKISFTKQYFNWYVTLMCCFIFLKRIEAALLVIDVGKAKALHAFMDQRKKPEDDAMIIDYTGKIWERIGNSEEKTETEEIRRSLKLKSNNSSALLYSFDHDYALHIWIVNGEDDIITFKQCEHLEEFESFFRFMHSRVQLILDWDSSFYEPDSSESTNCNYESKAFDSSKNIWQTLYKVLIHSVKKFIKGNKLIIVPDKFLFLVPFCSLEDEKGCRLSENYSVQVTPSLHTLVSSMTRSRDPNGFALFVGNPTVGKVSFRGKEMEPSNLPSAKKEVQCLAQLFDAQPLLESEATKERVLKFIQTASIIHIAAHGEPWHGEILLAPNPDAAKQSFALPTEDSYLLKQKDIMNININARLVVLSCCHTGKGEISSEGVFGLARAFLAAGARTVLATLWPIRDNATKEFMEIFYGKVCNEFSICEALRRTMHKFQKHKNEQFRKFEVWAPFTIYGENVKFTERDIKEIKQKSRVMYL